MKKDFKQLSLSRALLAGLLCGIITAMVIGIFVVLYRDKTDFERLLGLNSTVIFAFIPLVVLIAAGIYYLLAHYYKNGEALFIILFIGLLLFGLVKDMSFHRSLGETLMNR